MFKLTQADLKELLETVPGPKLSILLPTPRSAPDAPTGKIHLKNLLRQAEEDLTQSAMSRAAIRTLLAPLHQLLADPDFWQTQATGLALYRTPETFRQIQLPFEPKERVALGDHFYLTPLLPLLDHGERFLVLALSQKNVRLLEADRHGCRELDLEDMPTSLTEALGHDWKEKTLQAHTSNGAPGRAAVFHGQGGITDDSDTEIVRFCQLLDHALRQHLKSTPPLVLAGVESLLATFRRVSHYPNLVAKEVTGNPELLDKKTLHEQAWEAVTPVFRNPLEQALQRCRELADTPRGSHEIPEIVAAAIDGRVEQLVVVEGNVCWGTFDPLKRRVEIHSERHGDEEDLINLSACETLRHGGQVFTVPEIEAPGCAPAAAVYRYAS